jgi:peptidoglycan L-alanyl-D-glutamate endopeptidase CwlK
VSALLMSRVDTSLAHPVFLTRLTSLLDEALSQGMAFWVIELYRSYARSDELFAQGRTKPGPIVTRARAGQSAHNFGIAGDLVRDGYLDRAGLQPDWRPESYEPLRELAPKHGLVWGGAWAFKDLPHVQLPGFVTSDELSPLRRCFDSGGLQAVFAYVDQHITQF